MWMIMKMINKHFVQEWIANKNAKLKSFPDMPDKWTEHTYKFEFINNTITFDYSVFVIYFIRYIYYWNLQFLNNVIIITTDFFSLSGIDDISRIGLFCWNPWVLLVPKTLNYLTFQWFDFDGTWWRLFLKRVVCTIN